MREITSCEVCSNTQLLPALNLGEHPLPDDLQPVGQERLSKTYPVEVLYCDKCCTAHQRFQVSKHKLFPLTYHYRARQTADVLTGMQQLATAVGDVRGLKVLDVGCNDGSLLDCFKANGAETYGIEPTDAALDARAKGHIVTQAFLDQHEANRFVIQHGRPDVITFTNVFAHIEYLGDLLTALEILCGRGTKIVIENHYLGSVLDRHQFDTFYHEHPRTYSYTSFEFIADRLGMHVADIAFPERYGGNIRVTLEAGKGMNAAGPIETEFGQRLEALGRQVKEWRRKKRAQLLWEYNKRGPIACAAFPGRAAILMRLLGLSDEVYDKVYEKPGSKKIGFYVPGTHVPIVSDELYPAHFSSEDTPLLNLAWHIPAEIESRWRMHGFKGRILQVIDPTDFTSP